MCRMRAERGAISTPSVPGFEYRRSFRNVIEDCRSFDEAACFRLPNPFAVLRCTRIIYWHCVQKLCCLPPGPRGIHHDRTDGGLRQWSDQLWRPRLLALPAPLVCAIDGVF